MGAGDAETAELELLVLQNLVLGAYFHPNGYMLLPYMVKYFRVWFELVGPVMEAAEHPSSVEYISLGPGDAETTEIGLLVLQNLASEQTRTRTYTNPYDTKAYAAG